MRAQHQLSAAGTRFQRCKQVVLLIRSHKFRTAAALLLKFQKGKSYLELKRSTTRANTIFPYHSERSENCCLSNLQMGLPRDREYEVSLQIGDRGEIRLLRGDITQYPSDAIVNAANSELLPGGGVCGAIHRAGGPLIADECRRILSERGRLAAGKAVATTAGDLPAKYVIHAVGPVWQGGDQGEAEVLASCYRESVRIADDLKLHSIAFPAIST